MAVSMTRGFVLLGLLCIVMARDSQETGKPEDLEALESKHMTSTYGGRVPSYDGGAYSASNENSESNLSKAMYISTRPGIVNILSENINKTKKGASKTTPKPVVVRKAVPIYSSTKSSSEINSQSGKTRSSNRVKPLEDANRPKRQNRGYGSNTRSNEKPQSRQTYSERGRSSIPVTRPTASPRNFFGNGGNRGGNYNSVFTGNNIGGYVDGGIIDGGTIDGGIINDGGFAKNGNSIFFDNGDMGPIPGVAGVDYPALASVPNTGFTCIQRGYYADTAPEAACQVFHICQDDERLDSFLCPNGTLFNQQYFVCDWWFNFDCSSAPDFYGLNEEIGKVNNVHIIGNNGVDVRNNINNNNNGFNYQ